ncbi:Na+/H+ antiporter subunit E [Acinetobacter faecalis]|uniref:Na+/H+ antiporter subunit E n=1 Tax=Acinetobacter faecalis TaxID=2665161 RepID=UPI002A90BFD9|nr:Na+/H+ antiporter subunit E [Acinetobacter faecalis]MDY6461619.1 Na+/H+ antiporter subunit E [Acinetobacter faecalis]
MQKISFVDRWFPHPLVSVLCGLSWIMLAQSLEVATLVMALLLAFIIPKLLSPFIDRTPNINWMEALKLFFVVVWDIILCNINVAKLVLGPTKNLHPKWFRVPLDTEHEEVNSILAMIITTTPGTVTAGIDQDRCDILVHALSTDDIESEIKTIKTRYEQPLMRIFGVKVGDKS